MRDAAEDLAREAHRAPVEGRRMFQTVSDVAILGTVLISGGLAAVHLYRALFPQHKEAHPGPEPADRDRVPPRRHVSHADAAADGYERGRSR
jgi:hypothetical protein